MAPIAKSRPKLLEKREQKAEIAAIDRAENLKVKQRSGGQCEVLTGLRRCARRASHVHHLISGIGRRNVGESLKSAHKLHVCDRCHDEIHGHVLKPINAIERECASTVNYERIK